MEDKNKDLPKEEFNLELQKTGELFEETTSTKLDESIQIGIESRSKGIDDDSSNQSKKLGTEIVLSEELKSDLRELLKSDFDDSVKKQKEEIKREGQEIKKDFLTIFGIFASFVTFLSIEVQVFKNKENVFELIGICSISLSFVMLFALIINDIAKDKSEWSDLKKPTYFLNLIFLVVGIVFLSIEGTSSNKQIELLDNKSKSDSTEINLLKQNINQLTKENKYLDSINSILNKPFDIKTKIGNPDEKKE